MKNPVESILPGVRNTVLLYLAGLNAGIIAISDRIALALRPHTIIGFELTGTLEGAKTMLTTWEANHATSGLFFLLGFDYFFLLIYSFTLWFACLHLAAKVQGKFATFMIILAWLQPLAGLLDAFENGALYHVASGSQDASLPMIARYCAIPKFVIVIAGFVCWAVGSIVVKYVKKPQASSF